MALAPGPSSGGAPNILALALLCQSQHQERGDGSGFFSVRVAPLLQGPEGRELSPDCTESPVGCHSVTLLCWGRSPPLSNPTSAKAPLQVSDDLCPSLESCLGPWGHKALPLMCVLEEPVGELTRAGIKVAATRPSFTVPHRDRRPLWPVLVPSQRQGDQWALLRSPSTEALGSPLRPLEGRRGRGPPPGGLDQPRQCPEVARLDRQAGGP